jgi:hypothetical protein
VARTLLERAKNETRMAPLLANMLEVVLREYLSGRASLANVVGAKGFTEMKE